MEAAVDGEADNVENRPPQRVPNIANSGLACRIVKGGGRVFRVLGGDGIRQVGRHHGYYGVHVIEAPQGRNVVTFYPMHRTVVMEGWSLKHS
jgi:hypothetical protein